MTDPRAFEDALRRQANATVDTMSVEARRALTKYTTDHFGDLSDIENLAQTLFNAGGRTMLETTKEFSGMEARLTRLEQQISEVLTIWRMVAPGETK